MFERNPDNSSVYSDDDMDTPALIYQDDDDDMPPNPPALIRQDAEE